MKSVLDIECSMFAEASETKPENVNLLEWLKSKKYLNLQDQIQAEKDIDRQKALKVKMPCITASGQFSKRGKAFLVKHTGLIAIDIDAKDNLLLPDLKKMKDEICKIENVAYCGHSVSGKGFFAIMPIRYPDKHKEHFQLIEFYLKSKNVIIDSACHDIARLRFYSYDPEAYYNHEAKPLEAYYRAEEPPKKPYQRFYSNSVTSNIGRHYNQSNDFMNVLFNHGWKIDNVKGNKTYFTRPGKSSGISAEYDSTKTCFFVFTSEAPPFEGSKGYNPFKVYTLLEHHGNYKQAAKELIRRK